MRLRRGASFAAVLAGAALMLGACGSGGDTPESEPEENPSAEAGLGAQDGAGGPYTEEQLNAVLGELTMGGASAEPIDLGDAPDLGDLEMEVSPEECAAVFDSQSAQEVSDATMVAGQFPAGIVTMIGDADADQAGRSTTLPKGCEDVTISIAGTEVKGSVEDLDTDIPGADASLVTEAVSTVAGTETTTYQAAATIGTAVIVVISQGEGATADAAVETAGQAVELLQGQ